MNSQFWKNKTVLVTGHTGFKGSWLSIWLQKLGTNVIGYSKSIPTNPSLFELARVGDKMTSILGDVSDYQYLEKTIKEHTPEIVIHMAAQAILRESYKNPLETFMTNVIGTANILEAIRNTESVKAALNITSDKCYAIKTPPYDYSESDSMGGYDPYSSSKGCAELVTSSYRNSFFNPNDLERHGVSLASARAGNVIGGGDWGTDRLIPDIIRGLIENKTITIRHPDAVRPWQHVLDVIRGYLLLTENLYLKGPQFAEGWNFGPTNDEVKPVRWIVTKLIERWGGKANFELDSKNNPYESPYLSLNCSKAKSKLGWISKMNLDMTVDWTVEWYKQYQQKHDMREFSEEQIDRFILL